MEIIDLNEEQLEDIENRLEEYDESHITYRREGSIHIGIKENNQLIAGLDACMTAFKIMYVSTVFVNEEYRRQGYGTILMKEMESRAKRMGANTIRLDTFDWQGKEFYEVLGYQLVGNYSNNDDHYSEYFFLKRI